MSEHEHFHHHDEEGHQHHHHHEHHHEDGSGSGNDHHHHHHHHENGNGTGNGDYVVVPPTPQSSVDNQVSSSSVDKVLDFLTNQDEIQRALIDIGTSAEAKLTETVRAEADSSSSSSAPPEKPKPSEKQPQPPKKESAGPACGPNASMFCPYYLMAVDRLSKVQVPPKVKDLLLWKDPKLTGAIFGSSFVLLISIAWFSLLTVVSGLFLTALTLIGSYRFYLGLIYRIKGTYDNTFDKLSSQDLSLPKDKVQHLARLLETDFNRVLNKLKSILLWDNITTSGLAFVGFYVIYCIGCMFNTITLLILALVSAFTLPKVYDVYKQPIDQAIEKATSAVHQTVKQIMTKVPMLNKKKTQ